MNLNWKLFGETKTEIIMVTFILLLWLIPIAVNVYVDRNGRKPNYGMMFVLRGMAAVVHGVIFDIFCNYFPDNLHLYSYWQLFLIFLPLLLFYTTSFWIIFELALNKVCGRELLYYDRKERDSGWIDQVFDVLGNGPHFVAKLLALGVLILSIITIYNKV